MDTNNLNLYFDDLTEVTFVANDFAITDGQSFQSISDNSTLPEVIVTNKGNRHFVLTIKADRKHSKEVAEKFKEWVGDDTHCVAETTSDTMPGSLNFAVKGTLTLKGGITKSFDDVVIAQGHHGAYNNWWIGGKDAKKILNDVTLVFGTSKLDVSRVNILAFYAEGHDEFKTAYYLQG